MEHYESMASEFSNLQEEMSVLQDEHQIVNDLHANERKRADELHQLHALASQEKNELSSLADDIVAGLENGDLTASGRHDLEVKILKHVNTLKREIDQSETLVNQLEGDLAQEKKLVARLEKDIQVLEADMKSNKYQLSETERLNRRHGQDKDQLARTQESLQRDLAHHASELEKSRKAHASELQRADELDDALNIASKEHAALKDIHDTLLADFKAGNYEQFRKDLDTKLASFDNLIDEQEAELKDLKSQKDSQYKTINENLEALILDASNETREIASLKKYQTKLLQSFRGGAVSTKRSKSRSPSRYNGY